MKVSVLMITFNHQRYIAQAVQSVLQQRTHFDYELVIGEDCSTDGTRAILEDLAAKNPARIRLLPSAANLGASRNYARTYEACRGQYVAQLEGDDYWTDPDKLRIQAEALDAHPDWAMCFHRVRQFSEDGSQPPFLIPVQTKPVLTVHDLIRDGFPLQTCGVMFRHRLFGPFPEFFFDRPIGDIALYTLNARHGLTGFVDRTMADYRQHGAGMWTSRSAIEKAGTLVRLLLDLDQHTGQRFHDDFVACIATRMELACGAPIFSTRTWGVRWMLLRWLWGEPPTSSLPLRRRLDLALGLCLPLYSRRGRRRILMGLVGWRNFQRIEKWRRPE